MGERKQAGAREEELESGSLIVLMVLVEAKHVPGPRVEVEGRGQWILECAVPCHRVNQQLRDSVQVVVALVPL